MLRHTLILYCMADSKLTNEVPFGIELQEGYPKKIQENWGVEDRNMVEEVKIRKQKMSH